jgi:hypothetical protein
MSDTAAGTSGAPPSARPPNRVRVTWRGDEAFEAGRPDGPAGMVDGHGKLAQSPVDWLLSALAACSAIDAVQILLVHYATVATFAE